MNGNESTDKVNAEPAVAQVRGPRFYTEMATGPLISQENFCDICLQYNSFPIGRGWAWRVNKTYLVWPETYHT